MIRIATTTIILAALIAATSPWDIAIPIDTIVRGHPGTIKQLAAVPVPDDLQGLTCTTAWRSDNNTSVHPDNDLLLESATTAWVRDVERTADAVTIAGDPIVLGDVLVVSVRFGPDMVFSSGGVLTVDCPPATTTTTEATTTTTEVPPSSTTTTTPPTTSSTQPTPPSSLVPPSSTTTTTAGTTTTPTTEPPSSTTSTTTPDQDTPTSTTMTSSSTDTHPSHTTDSTPAPQTTTTNPPDSPALPDTGIESTVAFTVGLLSLIAGGGAVRWARR